MNIKDQVIVITGGASGVGLACSNDLAGRGARVWALDRDARALERAGALAPDSTNAALTFVHCDVSREDDVRRVVALIERQGGGIDILVNNAAVLRDQTLVSKVGRVIKTHSLSDWQETLDCNVTGTFLMAREVAEAMIRSKRGGLIVNTSSISRYGNPGQTAYAASKAAIDAMTVTWSQELAVHQIRVVAIAPGFVKTPMTERIPPMFLQRIREETPLRRYGSLEEAAHTLRYVIENDYLNGKTLEWDGGLRF